jgi:serine/threonine-protein kinase
MLAAVPTSGDVLGRYRLDATLGRGAMGQVFSAFDTTLKRRVAIKVVLPGDDGTDGRARLVREAQAAAALDHPNAVRVYDVGEHEGIAFIAMELVDGEPLGARVARGATVVEIVRWLDEVASALAAAHDLGLVHRDVKPDNVMIRRDGRAVVLDFGIARRVTTGAAVASTLTGAGMVVGTPLYMSPEQLRGEPVDGRSDQFSWGVLAYECLTGRAPWGDAGNGVAVISAILSASPPPIDDRVPPALSAVIARALEKSREARFPDMRALIVALGGQVEGPPRLEAAPTVLAPASVVPPSPLRRRAALAGVALLVVALAVVAGRSSGTKTATSVPAAPSASSTVYESWRGHCAVPAADAALQEGNHLLRTKSNTLARRRWSQGLELDPSCALVNVRMIAALTWGDPDSSRAFFNAAQAGRDRLDEHDRAFLQAIEPLYRAVRDVDETSARLAGLMARYPRSVELRMFAVPLLPVPERAARIRELQEVEPELVVAHALRAFWMDSSDEDAILRELETCVQQTPGAAMCLSPLTTKLDARGECKRLEDAASAWLLADKEHPSPWRVLAGVRLGRGADPEAVATLLGQFQAREAGSSSEDAIGAKCALAEAAGDFEGAQSCAARVEEQCAHRASCHAWAWERRIKLAFERGQTRDAVSLIEAAIRASDGWIGSRSAHTDETGVSGLRAALAVARGKPVPPEIAAIERRLDVQKPGHPLEAWQAAWGGLMFLTEKGAEAVAALPRAVESISDERVDAEAGVALVRAGRLAEGEAVLARVVRRCDALADPLGTMRALLALGEVREKRGDVSGARAAYGRIVAAWGNAKPRSITADAARKRLAALQ